jgi:protein-S-isoprenylcysteine O-methyltransferase Ste14
MTEDKHSNIRRHHDREDLAGEHVFGDLGQLILLIIFLTAWIIDSFFVHYSTFTAKSIPLFVRIPAAALILLISGYIAKAGLKIVFGEVREVPVVIREGVFAVVRHPVYLGAILLYLGLIALTFSLISAVIWIFIIAFYHFIAGKEEKLLLEKFGKEYETYIRDVPMWLPRIIRKKG